MAHLVPFHRSARTLPLPVLPTAAQAVRAAHDTLIRKPPAAGVGVGWILQRTPFHRSARVLPFGEPPTAVQADDDVHEMLLRAPPAAGVGVG